MENVFSGKYKILDSCNIILYDKDSDLEFVVTPNEEFSFTVCVKVLNDGGERKIEKVPDDDKKKITITCRNFAEGAGTVIPLELAKAENKAVSMHLWISKLAASNDVFKIEYTIYLER